MVGAPVGVVIGAVEKLDTELRQGAQRTAERGARRGRAGARGPSRGCALPGNVWSTLLDTALAPRGGRRGWLARAVPLRFRNGQRLACMVHHAPPVLVVRPPQP